MVSCNKFYRNALEIITYVHFHSHNGYILPYVYFSKISYGYTKLPHVKIASESHKRSYDRRFWGLCFHSLQCQQVMYMQTTKPKGGYACCVPGCYSNTKRNKNLSFYMIPLNGLLRTRWLNAIKRKDFVPIKQHWMCSMHFKRWVLLTYQCCFFCYLRKSKSSQEALFSPKF